jgi:hypothetical protein
MDQESRCMTTEGVVLKAIAASRVAELTATAASYSPADIGPATAPLYPELFRRLRAAGVGPAAGQPPVETEPDADQRLAVGRGTLGNPAKRQP